MFALLSGSAVRIARCEPTAPSVPKLIVPAAPEGIRSALAPASSRVGSALSKRQ